MAETIEARVIQKIATASEWATSDLVPYKGEVMLVSDSSGKVVNFKTGNGINKFIDLPYIIQYDQAAYIEYTNAPIQPVAYTIVGPGTYGSIIVDDEKGAVLGWDGESWSINNEFTLPKAEVVDVLGLDTEKPMSQNLVSNVTIDERNKSIKTSSVISNRIRGNINSSNIWGNTLLANDIWCALISIKSTDDIIINVANSNSAFVAFLTKFDVPVNGENASIVSGSGYLELTSSTKLTVPSSANVLYVYLGSQASNYNRLPNSIYINGVDIINDITSRESLDNKVISDVRSKSRLVNPLEIARQGNIMRVDASSPWLWRNTASTTTLHNIIPVYKGDVVGIAPRIKETGTIYALLKYDLKNIKDYGYVPFLNGTTRNTINEYTEITITEDCYLYYYIGDTWTPEIFINGTNINYTDYQTSSISTFDFYDINYYYQTLSQTPVYRINYYHILIPVAPGDEILFDGGSTYGFLSTDDSPLTNGKTVSFVSGYTQTYTVTSSEITVPSGTQFLYAYLGSLVDGDLDRRPNGISKNGTPLSINWIDDKLVGNINGLVWSNTVELEYKATKIIPVVKVPYLNLELYSAVPYGQDIVNFFNKDGIKVAYINPSASNNVIRKVVTYNDFISNTGVIKYLSGYTKDDIYSMQVFNEETLINKKPFFRSNVKLLDVQEFLETRIEEQAQEIARNESYARQELLVFEDNFDTLEPYWQGVNFDSTNYMTTWSTDSSVFFVKDSILHLVCKKVTGGARPFEGVFIKTTNKLEFPEGRIEVKMRMDTSYGFGGGVWSIGTYPEWADCWELDYMETFGSTSWEYPTTNAHYASGGVNESLGSLQYTDVDLSRWNIHAVEWSQEKIMFFINDIKIREVLVDTLNPDYPISTMDLRFNIKAGEIGVTIDPNDMEDSATLYVDYVKVYTTKENGGKYPLTNLIIPSTFSVNVGQTKYIEPTYVPSNATQTAFILSSSNDSIAKIREDWTIKDKGITGVSAGTATITATSADGTIIKSMTVTVS